MYRVLFASLALALVFATPSFAQSANPPINVQTIWRDIRVATNAASTSQPLKISERSLTGFFSLQFGFTATTGTVARLYVECSNDGTYWCVPDGMADIDTAIATGTNFYGVTPPLSQWLRFVAVTSNDGAVITGNLCYQ